MLFQLAWMSSAQFKTQGLFKLDERVDNILSSPAADESIRITALRKALSVPFTTLENILHMSLIIRGLQHIRVLKAWNSQELWLL